MDSDEFYQLQSIGEFDTIISKSESLNSEEEVYWFSYAKIRKAELAVALTELENFRTEDQYWNNKFNQLKGLISIHQGNFEVADQYLKDTLTYFENIFPNSIDHADTLNMMGNLQMEYGDLDSAKHTFECALQIYETRYDLHKESIIRGNLGLISKKKSNYQDSIDQFQKAIEGLSTVGNLLPMANFMLHLTETFIQFEAVERAEAIFQDLQDLTHRTENIRIKLFADYCEGLILLTRKNFLDYGKAGRIFEQIIQMNDFRADLQLNSIQYLLQILLSEYKLFNDPSVFTKISGLVATFYSLALQERLYPKVIDALIIQSKLMMVDGQYLDARDLVDKAKILSETHNLGESQQLVLQEIENLEKHLITMKELVNTNAKLINKLDEVNLLDYLQSLSKD